MTRANGGSPSRQASSENVTRADDRSQRTTRRTENSVEAVVCRQLHIRSTTSRAG
jgi:hypothetical protein